MTSFFDFSLIIFIVIAKFSCFLSGTTESSPTLDKWCGNRRPSFVSTSSNLLIRFETDDSYDYRGFKMRFISRDVCKLSNLSLPFVCLFFVILQSKAKLSIEFYWNKQRLWLTFSFFFVLFFFTSSWSHKRLI